RRPLRRQDQAPGVEAARRLRDLRRRVLRRRRAPLSRALADRGRARPRADARERAGRRPLPRARLRPRLHGGELAGAEAAAAGAAPGLRGPARPPQRFTITASRYSPGTIIVPSSARLSRPISSPRSARSA